MASSTMLLLPPHPFHSLSFCSRTPLFSIKTYPRTAGGGRLSVSASSRALHALIFDCDGVILESEHLHRQAYNDAFTHFNVCCPSSSSSQSLVWSPEFYDVLQNQIGGGKPKMRWYFKENGWPTSKVFDAAPETDDDRAKLIDILQLIVEAVDLDRELHTYLIIGGNKSVTPLGEDQQLETAVPVGRGAEGRIHQRGSILGASCIRKQDWKTERYKEIIKSGTVEPRPGVLRLMDEAKAAGKKLAVCSAATKSSVILCLENLIGMERFQGLDCFLAGDDVKEKKPDPLIYITAAERLRVSEKDCLVVEDSVIGLQAATRAGMSCVITYTSSTANQDFKEAAAIYPDLSEVRLKDLESLLQNVVTAN